MKALLLPSLGGFLIFEWKMFFLGGGGRFLSFSADGRSAGHCDFEVFVRGGELESCCAIFHRMRAASSPVLAVPPLAWGVQAQRPLCTVGMAWACLVSRSGSFCPCRSCDGGSRARSLLVGLLGNSLVAQLVKNLPAVQDTQVWKIPWRRQWHPTPVFLPGESHGRRSLAGYSPWGHKSWARPTTTTWVSWGQLPSVYSQDSGHSAWHLLAGIMGATRSHPQSSCRRCPIA